MRAYAPFIACASIAIVCWAGGAHWAVSLLIGAASFGMHLWGYQGGYNEERARRKRCVK